MLSSATALANSANTLFIICESEVDSSWIHLLVCVMKIIIRTLISVILLFKATIGTDAQSVSSDGMLTDSVAAPASKPGLGKRLDNKLTDIYFKLRYDTTYVARPKQMVFPHLLRFPLVKMVLLPRSSHEPAAFGA